LVDVPDAALAVRAEWLDDALAKAPDNVTALGLLDFQTYLGSILDRQDKMSMAASLEARVPFLDNEVIEFSRSLPLSHRQSLRHRKRVLKTVALRYLPAEIVHRRKSGFGVPLPSWLSGNGPVAELAADALAGDGLADVLDLAALRRLAADHRSGKGDYSDILWSALNLSLWRARFGV
jgi:asparagine synthase (glutamine-hydrolysing)